MIRTSDRTRRLRVLLAVLLLASLTVITVDFRTGENGPLDKLGRGALAALGPVQRGLVTMARPLGNFFAGFTKVPSLRERVARLERENDALRAERQQVEEVMRENGRLRQELSLRARLGFRTMPAQVIGVSPSNFERTIFIDKGSSDGVRKDLSVICCEGLVGRVISVGPSTSTVLLVIDRSSAVAARVASSGETGVVQGSGSGRLDFELFDPEAQVAVGDKVFTSGYQGGLYPRGIPIGTVTNAPAAGARPTRVVEVQPFVDFSTLDNVLLVLGEQPDRKETRP